MNTIKFLENGQVCVTVAGTPFVLPANSRPEFRNEDTLCVFVTENGETVLTTNTSDFYGALFIGGYTIPAEDNTAAANFVRSFFTGKKQFSFVIPQNMDTGDLIIPLNNANGGLCTLAAFSLRNGANVVNGTIQTETIQGIPQSFFNFEGAQCEAPQALCPANGQIRFVETITLGDNGGASFTVTLP